LATVLNNESLKKAMKIFIYIISVASTIKSNEIKLQWNLAICKVIIYTGRLQAYV